MTFRLRRAAAFAAAATLALGIAAPADAQLVVFDPRSYVQSVLTAARELRQIDNQITQIENQAKSLVNEARNLASLPYSSLAQLQASIKRTQALLGEAQGIAYDVARIDSAFKSTYAPADASMTDEALVANAQARWQQSVEALQDAMRVQATVVGNLDTNRGATEALIGASQGATGALQATQAGNQLLGLQAQQLADLTATIAAQGRAQALTAAQTAAAQNQAQEQLRRFLTPGAAYAPSDITMFH